MQKLLLAGLLTVLCLTIASLALFLLDHGEFGQRQRDRVRSLKEEAGRLKQAVVAGDARLAEQRTQLAAQQLRSKQAEKVAATLDDLSSGFSRLTTDSAQNKENDERMARMKEMEHNALVRAKELEQLLTRTQWEKDGAEIALQRNAEQIEAVKKDDSEVLHYVRGAWDGYINWVLGFVALVIVVPPLLRSKAPG